MENTAFTIGQEFTNTSSNKLVAISQIRDSGDTIVVSLVNDKGEVSTNFRDTETWSLDEFSKWVRRGLYEAK